jgi:hypothetical protein
LWHTSEALPGPQTIVIDAEQTVTGGR